VLGVGAAHAGRALGPKGERAASLVLEGEHLLLDDVRGLADSARENLGVLEDRRLEVAVARAPEQVACGGVQLQPRVPVLR
jgi:hypothetical protein